MQVRRVTHYQQATLSLPELLCLRQGSSACIPAPEWMGEPPLQIVSVELETSGGRPIISAEFEGTLNVQLSPALRDLLCFFVRGDGKLPVDAAADHAAMDQALLLVANVDEIGGEAKRFLDD